MAHAENEIVRSTEDVYAFLADGLNNTRWREGVKSMALKSGTPGQKGAVYSQTLSGPGGRDIRGDYEITEAAAKSGSRSPPGRRVPAEFIPSPRRRRAPRVRFALDLSPKGLVRLAGPIITKTIQSEVAQLAPAQSGTGR